MGSPVTAATNRCFLAEHTPSPRFCLWGTAAFDPKSNREKMLAYVVALPIRDNQKTIRHRLAAGADWSSPSLISEHRSAISATQPGASLSPARPAEA